MVSTSEYNGLEIAIIGMSGKFPDSADHRQYWQNLLHGKEMLTTFSEQELRKRGVSQTALDDKRYVRTVGYLPDKDCFDTSFFGYSPDEAALMDPQIRLFHEQCWNALEDAGYASAVQSKKIGLFAGASSNDNWKIYAFGKAKDSTVDQFFLNMIASQTFIHSLVAYKLNLRGASYYVDTACSTSLSAVHLACRSLLTKDNQLALAGGVCLTSSTKRGYFHQQGMISSEDGHCRAFDEGASGTAVGEGAGVVLLKRLSEAINDRDHIYAVIRSTSANNDGNHKVGYTAPSVKGQADCITAAHKLAGVEPGTISYVEAHGTGTRLGDPVEVRALNEAFGAGGADKFCALGSVKTNIGHLDAAAGVAGLMKVALSLQHRQIPASLHFRSPNPQIDFRGGPFYVNAALQPWNPAANAPLRAGVSSFGIGGTNVHAVLEEAPPQQAGDPGRPFLLLTLSAKTPGSLQRYQQRLKDFLLHHNVSLPDMCYTLQVGRKQFAHRKHLVFAHRQELLDLLDDDKGGAALVRRAERSEAVVFLFPGQGAQYAGMGRDLYAHEPVFRREMDRGFALIAQLTGEDMRAVLFAHPGDERIHATRYTQPLMFLVEYAAAQLLMSLGVVPSCMIGHSIGEYTAACVSGLLAFEDALGLVVKRGELMDGLPGGVMVSVALSGQEASAYAGEGVSVAALNGPQQVVLSGDGPSMQAVMDRLEASGVGYVKLRTSHAFHSAMQQPVLEAFRQAAEKVTFGVAGIPFVSNLTGGFVTHREAGNAAYWVRHLREPVRFSEGLSTLLGHTKGGVFVEVGPGHSLCGLLRQQGSRLPVLSLNILRSAKEKETDVQYMAGRLGRLWSHGVEVNWQGYYASQKRCRVSLPTYCFEATRYPAEVDPLSAGLLAGLGVGKVHKAGAGRLAEWIHYPSWKRSVAEAVVEPQGGRRGYLFFSFNRGFSDSMAASLLRPGDELVSVYAAEGYQRHGAGEYSLHALKAQDYAQLIGSVARDGIEITDVIYSWGIGVDDARLSLGVSNQELHLCYFALAQVVQSLLRAHQLKGKRFVIVSDSLHRVIGTERVSSSQSLLLGLMQVLPQEYPVSCRNVDIALGEQGGHTMGLLCEELRDERLKADRTVAIRYGQRWVSDYQCCSREVEVKGSVIRPGGVYLITGGLGNMGYVLAQHLVEERGARVILMGRKSLQEVEREQGQGAGHYRHLRGHGDKVRYVCGDVGEPQVLGRLVEEMEAQGEVISGVIHAAGVTDSRYFELSGEITVVKALQVLSAKVSGMQELYRVFGHRPVDFVWVASSICTVLGGLGYGTYAAANGFMDHFISSKGEELSRWRSVGLSGLAFTQEEIVRQEGSLTPPELTELFEWSVERSGNGLLYEHKGNLGDRIGAVYGEKRTAYLDEETPQKEGAKLERPDLSSGYAQASTQTERKLKGMLEDFLGMSDLGVEDDFFELGGDSLKAMMLLKRLQREFEVELSLKDFFYNATIRGIAVCIDAINGLRKEPGAAAHKSMII